MDLKKVDPALELMNEFAKATNGMPAMVDRLRQKSIFSDGVVPIKFKILAAVLWSINSRCEPCFKYYIQQAIKQGATEAELGEFLAVASAMGGCVGEMWALKAYEAFKVGGDPNSASDEHCCS